MCDVAGGCTIYITSPSIFTDELSRLLFICLGLLVGHTPQGKTGIWRLTCYLDAERKSPTSFIFVYSDYRYYFATIIMVYGGGLLTMDTFD